MMTKEDCEHIAAALRDARPMSAPEMRMAFERPSLDGGQKYLMARQWEIDCNAIAQALQGCCINNGGHLGRYRYSEFLQMCGFGSERVAP